MSSWRAMRTFIIPLKATTITLDMCTLVPWVDVGEKLTDHYACKNADLNLRLVVATSNRFIFQIIDSLIQSLGLRLTCLDCNNILTTFYLDYVLTTSGENGHWSLLELKGFSLNLDVA